MTSSIIPFVPLGGEEYSKAETERKNQLFAWLDRKLLELGYVDRIKQATDREQLGKIVFDPDAADVALVIRETVHPTGGVKADFLQGLTKGAIKRLLRMRFDEMKCDRDAELQRSEAKQSKSKTYNWVNDLKRDSKDHILPSLSNLILFLTWHPTWKGVYAFDAFANRVVIRKPPPWRGEAPADFTDHHETLTQVWFEHEDINAGLGKIGRAIQAAARNNTFHPVRDYLDALAWDGTPRLDTWLPTYFHVDDTEYVRAIGQRWLISSVARIYQPGCQADHTLVLEGPQGRLKSQALRTLPNNQSWFTDRLSHIGNKDAAIELTGCQIIELAEMDALTKAASSTSKSYLTRQHDRFRPPYGKHTINLLRQCVFAATINPPVGGYLKDATGSRRFWPIACHGQIDLAGIERDRDQLWAEAVHAYKAGAKWWLETPALEALAKAEQDARFQVDVWTEQIQQWLGEREDTSVVEVLEGAMKIVGSEQTRRAEMRVAKILTYLGFEKYRAVDGDKRPNRYWKPQKRV